LNLKQDVFRIGITGRLHPVKGHKHLLIAVAAVAAVAQSQTIECLVVGDGESRQDLEALADELGIENQVRFLGYRDDIADILATLDVLVISSLSEGLSLSMLEGMASGRAIIATNVGGIPEIITDGKTGILVPPEDSESIAQAVLRLESDRALREDLGRNARRECLNNYMIPKTVEQFSNLYRNLLR
jgi:glycosyltransferase involved in cell wall biosynthesis